MRTRLTARLGWPLLITLCLLPIVMWMVMLPLGDRFTGTYLTLTSIGRVTGLAAIVFFCFNLMLTTRLPFIESLFGGLNKVFMAHHIIGGSALILALIHSTALVLRVTSVSLSEAARSAVPFTTNWPTTFGIFGLWGFIVLMVITFYVALPYRIWLFTHKFLGGILLLLALHIIFITSDLSTNKYLKVYMLIVLVLAAISYIYRTLLPRFFARRYHYQVSNVEMINKSTSRISLIPVNKGLDFRPGQFIFVSFRIAGFSKEWHPFSISSNTAETGIVITVKGLGIYTSSLVKLSPSMLQTDVWVEGAYGRFSFRNFKAKHQVWVAGGIGITPFLSMMRDVKPDYKIDLYYSVKAEEELMDIPHIKQWIADSQGTLTVYPIITTRDGQLTAKKISQLSGDLQSSEILLCGPPPMMHAIRDQLMKTGVNKHRIHTEEFALT